MEWERYKSTAGPSYIVLPYPVSVKSKSYFVVSTAEAHSSETERLHVKKSHYSSSDINVSRGIIETMSECVIRQPHQPL